jgi:hypothetical protein
MKILRNLTLIAVLGGMVGCVHSPVTVVTPQGQAAFTADQVVVRVNELENAAIAADKNGSLNDNTAFIIVNFTVDADKVLAATPDGWQAQVKALYKVLIEKLPPITNPAVQAALNVVGAAINTL